MAKNYSVGMEGESDSGGRVLIPEGDQILIIKSLEFIEKSSTGNPYFYWTLESENEGTEIKVSTTLIKGKRWLLKQLLSACGIEADENDPEEKYKFNEEDVIEKRVVGYIEHANNEFIGRDGNKVSYPKAEVKRFKKVEEKTSEKESAIEKKAKEKKTSKKDEEEIPF